MRRTTRLAQVALVAVAASTLGGCLGAPEIDGQTQALGSTAFANDQAAYDFFVSQGLTSFQAAGIVGNLDQESGVDPTIAQYGGGPGRGIAQWSVGGRWDTSANDNVVWYAGTKGVSRYSLDLQLQFIWYELTTYGYGFSALKATTNVTDATVVFMDQYEICGACDQSQRVAYANSVLNAYGSTPDWAAKFVSQTWPYASMPAFTVKCGESVAANIVLKNVGGQSWHGSTRLGTTMPRDRASLFAGDDWVSPNRAAAVSGTVAPGENGTFAFSFHGPTGADCVPGTYQEYFGVVQEGVAWFSDNGQGGPPDDQIEALIDLEPGDPGSMGSTGGGPAATDDGGTAPGTADGGTSGTGATPGDGNGAGLPTGAQGGCSVAPVAGGGGAPWMSLILIVLAIGWVRRRQKPRTQPGMVSLVPSSAWRACARSRCQ